MKAVRINEWGKPIHLEDIAQPRPAADEALVKIHAASINPVDTAIMMGYFGAMITPPMTLGTDFSGVVVEVGSNIKHVKPGDEVFGLLPIRSGTFSEYATPKSHEVALKPRTIDHQHASTLPLPAMAAWQSLHDLGQFKSGQRVLIHGVAGAVGGLAAQFAKIEGAYVYGTDIPEKADHVAKLGIDRFIDTSHEKFEDIATDVDVILDFIGGEYLDRSYSILKPGRRYVTALMMQTPQPEAEKRGITSLGLGAQASAELLAQIASLVDSGKLKVFVNRTFKLQEAQAALDYRMTSRLPGKVVFEIL